ncbi:hypothetical protein [Pelagibacterium sp.]|uniref:hypothetical protein n=1 Tax=Pelagibacterium sp. TaxID=1967288 RepID=UPI003A8F7701
MSKEIAVNVSVRSDDQGHWVEWANAGESGSLGPYQDADVAENVRAAKEREFSENDGHIDDATA